MPNPMKGFGVPREDMWVANRIIPKAIAGAPYFYYENVVLTLKGVWRTILWFLYDTVPNYRLQVLLCSS